MTILLLKGALLIYSLFESVKCTFSSKPDPADTRHIEYIGEYEQQPKMHSADEWLQPYLKKATLYGPSGKPSHEDVTQGNIANCFLVQTLSAYAATAPDFLKRHIQIDDERIGHYTVLLYNISKEAPNLIGVRVDSKLVYNATHEFHALRQPRLLTHQHNDKVILWPLLYEKAVAKILDYFSENGLCPELEFSEMVGEGYCRLQKGGVSKQMHALITGVSTLKSGGLEAVPNSHNVVTDQNTLESFLKAAYLVDKGSGTMTLTSRHERDLRQDQIDRFRHQIDRFRQFQTDKSVEKNCYRLNHVFPVLKVDYARGQITLYCDWPKTEVVLPFVEVAAYFPVFDVNLISAGTSAPETETILDLEKDGLTQPRLPGRSLWTDCVKGKLYGDDNVPRASDFSAGKDPLSVVAAMLILVDRSPEAIQGAIGLHNASTNVYKVTLKSGVFYVDTSSDGFLTLKQDRDGNRILWPLILSKALFKAVWLKTFRLHDAFFRAFQVEIGGRAAPGKIYALLRQVLDRVFGTVPLIPLLPNQVPSRQTADYLVGFGVDGNFTPLKINPDNSFRGLSESPSEVLTFTDVRMRFRGGAILSLKL